jgi:hypothetical protein
MQATALRLVSGSPPTLAPMQTHPESQIRSAPAPPKATVAALDYRKWCRDTGCRPFRRTLRGVQIRPAEISCRCARDEFARNSNGDS